MSKAPVIEMHITGERLMAMSDNGMVVYATPGADTAYWASQPSFMYDQVVRTPEEIIEDVLIDLGMDEDDLRRSETPITFLVELLEAL